MSQRLAILVFASILFLAACSSGVEGDSPGPTPTTISEEQVRRVTSYETATAVFEQQLAVSEAEVERWAAEDATDALIDEVIRREGGRLIRVVWASIEEYGRKADAARLECRCNIEPLNFSQWMDERLQEVDAWVRRMEAENLQSPRPRALTTLDDIHTALAPLIVDLVDSDYSQRAGYLTFFLNNLRPGDPFAQQAEAISRVEALPANLRIQTSLWLNEGPLWKINPPSFAVLVTEIESGRPEEERRLLRTFTGGLLEKDYTVYSETDGVDTPALYELAALAAWDAPGLTATQLHEVEKAGASLFIHLEAQAFAAQIRHLRQAGFGRDELNRVRNMLLRSEHFDERETEHAALLDAIGDLNAYMAAAEAAQDAAIDDAILEEVATRTANHAYEFRHLPTLRNRFLNTVIAQQISEGKVSESGRGQARMLSFSPDAFIFDARYSNPAHPAFPDILGILGQNPQLLNNPDST